MKKRHIVALAAVLMLSGCDYEKEQIQEYEYTTTTSDYLYNVDTDEPEIENETTTDISEEIPQPINHGNAANIDGKTVIVSIFANDTDTVWDYDSAADSETMYKTLDYLKTATDWLTEQVSFYGGNAEFVFDWETNPELLMGANFYQKMIIEESTHYSNQKYFIESYINSQSLMDKYAADNILYMFFFNSDFSNQANPWSSPPTSIYGNYFSTEFINIYIRFDDYHFAPPSTYAHEILHTFGAHDLYYENTAINAEYVNYCTEINSNDIMYTVSDGEVILNELSELDAYYLGLVDSSEDVIKWGLLPSEYE